LQCIAIATFSGFHIIRVKYIFRGGLWWPSCSMLHQLDGDLPQPLTNIALKLLSVVVFVYSYMASLIQLLPNS